MTNTNNEIDYGDLTQVIGFAFEQMLKGIYTCLPGTVISYDGATKRARVRPAIQVMRTDGTFQDRPTIANCPVIHPAGGGFTVHLPIKAGDAVLMLFSQRGLSRFKQNFENAQPDEALLDIKDAIILPGFGGLELAPATADGVSMQSDDGENNVYVTDNHVQITSSSTVQIDANDDMIINADSVIMNADAIINGNLTWTGRGQGAGGAAPVLSGGVDVQGGTVTHNGVNIGNTHTHPGDSGGNTGNPN